VAGLAVLLVARGNDRELNVEEWLGSVGSNGLVVSIAILGSTLACVPLLKFLVRRHEVAPWRFLLLGPAAARSVGVWSLGLVAFVAASDLITVATGRPVVPDFAVDVYTTSQPVLLFIALVFAAPLFEEIFFRGFLIGALEASGVSALGAGVVAAIAWAMIHVQYDLYGVVTIFLMGVLLATARVKTGSVLPCVAMHSLANAIAFAETVFVTGAGA
jgi:hypothetical protein